MDENAIRDVFAERLVDRGLAEESARTIAAQLKPCVLLKLSYGWRPFAARRGGSRFGGWPDVPENFAWPSSRYDERWGRRPSGERFQLCEAGSNPLTFIAQLNLAEIHPHLFDPSLLPRRGLLSIFFDRREMPLGDDPDDPSGWRVLLFQGEEGLHPCAPPKGGPAPLNSCPIGARRWLSLPAQLGPFPARHELEERHWAAILEEAQRLDLDGSVYRMFGHAGAIKEAMEPEAERLRRGISREEMARWPAAEAARFDSVSVKAWRLLAQFPTDVRAKVDWCEAGTLFVWMHEDDLAARRFGRAWMTWQAE